MFTTISAIVGLIAELYSKGRLDHAGNVVMVLHLFSSGQLLGSLVLLLLLILVLVLPVAAAVTLMDVLLLLVAVQRIPSVSAVASGLTLVSSANLELVSIMDNTKSFSSVSKTTSRCVPSWSISAAGDSMACATFVRSVFDVYPL